MARPSAMPFAALVKVKISTSATYLRLVRSCQKVPACYPAPNSSTAMRNKECKLLQADQLQELGNLEGALLAASTRFDLEAVSKKIALLNLYSADLQA